MTKCQTKGKQIQPNFKNQDNRRSLTLSVSKCRTNKYFGNHPEGVMKVLIVNIIKFHYIFSRILYKFSHVYFLKYLRTGKHVLEISIYI